MKDQCTDIEKLSDISDELSRSSSSDKARTLERSEEDQYYHIDKNTDGTSKQLKKSYEQLLKSEPQQCTVKASRKLLKRYQSNSKLKRYHDLTQP